MTIAGDLVCRRLRDGKSMGYLKEADVAELAEVDRLRQLLVRCGGVRFTCAAQCVQQMIGYVEAGGDYVRDVSLPSTDPVYAEPAHVAKAERITREVAQAVKGIGPGAVKTVATPAECGRLAAAQLPFNEADCGGTFDGFGVVSDADPGL